MSRDAIEHSVYRCYDADDRLLYVGCTYDWSQREKQHRSQTKWWPQVARVRIEPAGSRADALAAERAAIQDESPRHNFQHARRVALTREESITATSAHSCVVRPHPTPNRFRRFMWRCDCGAKGGDGPTRRYAQNAYIMHIAAVIRRAEVDKARAVA